MHEVGRVVSCIVPPDLEVASSSRCDERFRSTFRGWAKVKNIITRREDAIGRVPQKVILGAGGSPRDWSLGGDRRSVVLRSKSLCSRALLVVHAVGWY